MQWFGLMKGDSLKVSNDPLGEIRFLRAICKRALLVMGLRKVKTTQND